MKFSLRFLAFFVTLEAIGCVALTRATPWFASVFVSLTVGAIAVMTLRAIVAKDANLAFCLGFVLVAGGYLLITVSPVFGYTTSTRLLTTQALVALEPILHELPEDTNPIYGGSSPVVLMNYTMAGNETRQLYYHIGQCLWALLLGSIGGLAMQWLRSESIAKESREHDSTPHAS